MSFNLFQDSHHIVVNRVQLLLQLILFIFNLIYQFFQTEFYHQLYFFFFLPFWFLFSNCNLRFFFWVFFVMMRSNYFKIFSLLLMLFLMLLLFIRQLLNGEESSHLPCNLLVLLLQSLPLVLHHRFDHFSILGVWFFQEFSQSLFQVCNILF